MITVFRSRSPWGPFEPGPDNPVLTARDEARPVLTGTGHGDLFEDDYGNWWIVFLCYRISTVKYHHLGRETALLPVIWENGWPKAAGGKCAKVHVAAVVNGRDSVRQAAREGEYFLDDFSGKSLNLKWNFIREFFDGYESGDEKVDSAWTARKSFGWSLPRIHWKTAVPYDDGMQCGSVVSSGS